MQMEHATKNLIHGSHVFCYSIKLYASAWINPCFIMDRLSYSAWTLMKNPDKYMSIKDGRQKPCTRWCCRSYANQYGKACLWPWIFLSAQGHDIVFQTHAVCKHVHDKKNPYILCCYTVHPVYIIICHRQSTDSQLCVKLYIFGASDAMCLPDRKSVV